MTAITDCTVCHIIIIFVPVRVEANIFLFWIYMETLNRNSTSFPLHMTSVLKRLLKQYETDTNWKDLLNYYQYLVRGVVCNSRIPGNRILDSRVQSSRIQGSRGMLLYIPMGMGKTRLAVSIAQCMYRDVIVLLPNSLKDNFKDTVTYFNKVSRYKNTTNYEYVSLDAYNAGSKITKQLLENKLLIVDEAHNLFRAIINSSSDRSNGLKIYNSILDAKNLYIIFLSGTPVAKDPFEIVPCFNMLTGKEILPSTYDKFKDLYIEEDGSVKNANYLANRLLGLVSHVSSPYETRQDKSFPEEKETIIEKVPMSPTQYANYLAAYHAEETEAKRMTVKGKKGAIKPLMLPKSSTGTYHVKSRMVSNVSDGYSPKIQLIVQRVLSSPGTDLIYSQFIKNGLDVCANTLISNGFVNLDVSSLPKQSSKKPFKGGVNTETDEIEIEDGVDMGNVVEIPTQPELVKSDNNRTLRPALRFITIHGEIPLATRTSLINIFNSPANLRGELIKVILISKTGAEGLNLKRIRRVHIIEPYWNNSRIEQIISRAVRIGSHDLLPSVEREVQPYIYLSVAPDTDKSASMCIDEMFMEKANAQFKSIIALRKLLEEVSIECRVYNRANCRVCEPNDKPLFSANPYLDVTRDDPCSTLVYNDVEVKTIIIGDQEYRYRKSEESVLGIEIYKYNKKLGYYALVEMSDPIYNEFLTTSE